MNMISVLHRPVRRLRLAGIHELCSRLPAAKERVPKKRPVSACEQWAHGR